MIKCSICKHEITADPYGWNGGNNADPINDGVCCHDCNEAVVIPARLELLNIKRTREQKKGG
tara:strand:+ start:74 stop:259 length:186 start_codon:yes stop_codon:yes gene_type:complete